MKKYSTFIRLSVPLLSLLFFLAVVNVSYLQVIQTDENKIQSKELCNSITDKLKFCTEKQKIVISKANLVTLNFSLKNITKNEIDVSKYDGWNYVFRVTNDKDEVITTILEQKMRNSEMSEDDEKTFIDSLVRNHRSVTLQPNEIYNEKIVLSDIYDFSNVGKYYVEITRKTRISNQEKLTEIPLGKIEIEVK